MLWHMTVFYVISNLMHFERAIVWLAYYQQQFMLLNISILIFSVTWKSTFYWNKPYRQQFFFRLVHHMFNLCSNLWRPTCLSIHQACGSSHRQRPEPVLVRIACQCAKLACDCPAAWIGQQDHRDEWWANASFLHRRTTSIFCIHLLVHSWPRAWMFHPCSPSMHCPWFSFF